MSLRGLSILFFGMWWAIFLVSCYLTQDVEGPGYLLGRIVVAGAVALVTTLAFGFLVAPTEEHEKKMRYRLDRLQRTLDAWCAHMTRQAEKDEQANQEKRE